MTFERKIVVGLEDIDSISLECRECKRRITFSPDNPLKSPNTCGCGHPWIPEDALSLSAPDSPFVRFFEALQVIRTLTNTKSYGVRILLEYKEPE
jgi:hypothetical protein